MGRWVSSNDKYKFGYLAWMSKVRKKIGVYMNITCTALSQEHIIIINI